MDIGVQKWDCNSLSIVRCTGAALGGSLMLINAFLRDSPTSGQSLDLILSGTSSSDFPHRRRHAAFCFRANFSTSYLWVQSILEYFILNFPWKSVSLPYWYLPQTEIITSSKSRKWTQTIHEVRAYEWKFRRSNLKEKCETNFHPSCPGNGQAEVLYDEPLCVWPVLGPVWNGRLYQSSKDHSDLKPLLHIKVTVQDGEY